MIEKERKRESDEHVGIGAAEKRRFNGWTVWDF